MKFEETNFQKSTEIGAVGIDDEKNLGELGFNIAFGLLRNDFAPISKDQQLSDYISIVAEKSITSFDESGTL